MMPARSESSLHGMHPLDTAMEGALSVPSIRSVATALCSLFGCAPPALADAAIPCPDLTARVERAMLLLPDAVGTPVWNTRPVLRQRVLARCPQAIALRSVLPPKTPVCFASMFTGALPEAHGIRTYAKPVLTCDTAFDALLRGGRRIALVAVAGSSMDAIFRDRAIDYHAEPYDPWVIRTAARLITADRHDLVVAYTQEYDDAIHRLPPLGADALACAERQVEGLERLADVAVQAWQGRTHAIAFLPDHGAHDCGDGHGDHGDDRPEDMHLEHFWGIAG
jgi:hypothetical protein